MKGPGLLIPIIRVAEIHARLRNREDVTARAGGVAGRREASRREKRRPVTTPGGSGLCIWTCSDSASVAVSTVEIPLSKRVIT